MKGDKWKPTLHGPQGRSNEYHDQPVSQFSCKWYLVFQVLFYFVSMALCKSLNLIVTSMQFNTMQFYLHHFVSVLLWDRNVVFDSTVQNTVRLQFSWLSSSLHTQMITAWAVPCQTFYQHKADYGTEVNGTVLNYMVEYLFIIYTANICASCNFSFNFLEGKRIAFYLLSSFFCIAGKKVRVSLFLSPPLWVPAVLHGGIYK